MGRRPRHPPTSRGDDRPGSPAAGFGTLLRRHRKGAGLTQEELAERSGLSVRAIRGLERGEGHRRPRPDTVGYLAGALGLSGEDLALFEEAARPGGPPSAPGPPLPDAPPDRPAEPLTPLVGRERLVAIAAALLRREGTRLLTLTGPGGVGKTRVGFKVAGDLRPDLADGAVSVGLEAVSDPALVASSVANALGLLWDEAVGDLPPLERLVRHLRDKEMLLFLDNFEQVRGAAPLLVGLLSGCPGLKMLVTSRAALRVRGEQELQVPPLEAPPELPSPGYDIAELARYPAVALLVERARAADPSFRLSEENAPAVAGICRRLDGLPLAIELAAARAKLLPPGALLERLEKRGLGLLSGGGPDLPGRQRTMRDAISWSHDLLAEEERALFRHLSIFAGGCTLEAAEAVCAPAPSGPEKERQPDVLDGLAALADASLLRRETGSDDGPRLKMLETVRGYARERLAASGEEPEVRKRHAAFFLDLAERAEPHLTGPEGSAWMDLSEEEHHNLRAALEWAREGGDAGATETGLRLAASLCMFWWTRGHMSEGRAWIEGFLTDTTGEEERTASASFARAKAFVGAGLLADGQGDHARASALYEEGLKLYRWLEDEKGAAFALANLGQATRARGEYERARALSEEGLALGRRTGDHMSAAVALNTLGHLARRRGEPGRSEALHKKSLAAFRAAGDARGVAYTLGNLGTVALGRGEADWALALYEESLRAYEHLKDKAGKAFALIHLGDAARAQGDEARAVPLYENAAALHKELGNDRGLARARERLAAKKETRPPGNEKPPQRPAPRSIRNSPAS